MRIASTAFAPALAGAVMFLAGIGSAQADERAGWSGVHLGLHAGGLSGGGTLTGALRGESRGCLPFIGCGPWAPFELTDTAPAGFAGLPFAGVSAGYDHQFGDVVVGVEADINRAEVTSGPVALVSALGGAIEIGSGASDLDWYATARARLGYAVSEDVMVFGTGGLAFANVTSSIGYSVGGFGDTVTSTDFRTGYSLGAGVEVKLDPRSPWSVSGDFLFTRFGKRDFFDVDLPAIPVINRNNTASGASALAFSTLSFGLNYRF